MPKIVRNITLDYDIWQKAKELRLNIPQCAENAIVEEIKKRAGNKEEEKEIVEELLEQRRLAEEKMQEARAIEYNCQQEDRELWNQTFLILKEQKTLPPENTPERIYKRFALYQELKAKKDAETKELL